MTFQTQPVIPTRSRPLDPAKHVNFTLGMVLGVDDFTQEFAYLSGRDQWLARDLLGFGTVCGLRVRVEPDARGPRVAVEPGTALTPRGQLVRVLTRQCAYLNEWLAARDTAVTERVGSPPGLRLHLVLCYRACATDAVPIPGEPCRSEDDVMASSRLTDDYVLELRFAPPDQDEEDAIREFVDWLSQVEVTTAPRAGATLEEFLAAVRASAQLGSPPSSPPSPPAIPRIPAVSACEYMRAAFRVWTTELRRSSPGADDTRAGVAPEEECVLLASLQVPVVREPPNWRVRDSAAIAVNEDRRPYVLSVRMLQEWVLCGNPPAAVPRIAGGSDTRPIEVVAAGTVRGDGETTAATYNRCVGQAIADGELLVTFNGYRQPRPPAPQYVVKALPVVGSEFVDRLQGQPLTVYFGRFDDRGVVLTVMSGPRPVPQDILRGFECMVEVSHFGSPVT